MGELECEDEKKDKVKFAKDQALALQKIQNGDTVFIKLKNPNKIVPKRAVQKKFKGWIVIYKEGEKQPIRLKY